VRRGHPEILAKRLNEQLSGFNVGNSPLPIDGE
jgi:hypothetical protein